VKINKPDVSGLFLLSYIKFYGNNKIMYITCASIQTVDFDAKHGGDADVAYLISL